MRVDEYEEEDAEKEEVGGCVADHPVEGVLQVPA